MRPKLALKQNANSAIARPICAWPKTASYKGSGAHTNAANCSCQ